MNNGFVNIFSVNLNKPYRDNHYFVLYDSSVGNLLDLNDFFEKKEGFLDNEDLLIDGKIYHCYTFEISNRITDIYENYRNNEIEKIPTDIINYIKSYWNSRVGFDLNCFDSNFKESHIKITDYTEDLADLILKQFEKCKK